MADVTDVAAAPAPAEAGTTAAVPRHPLRRRLRAWLFWVVIAAVCATIGLQVWRLVPMQAPPPNRYAVLVQ